MIFNSGNSTTTDEITRLVNAVNDSMEELTASVDTKLAELSTEVNTKITQLSNAVAGASFNAVKSIQRGVLTTQTGDSVITINPVNPDKCMVIIDSKYTTNNLRTPILLGITETTLTISALYYANSATTYDISWQLIEFY